MNKKQSHTILTVDDELSITKALKRLFRKEGYRILIANSGQEGLEVLEKENGGVSLIISDQRMPGMNGAQFLKAAKSLSPDAMRFLLTGYSDMDAIVDAVNQGEIHRYLTKPWNDDDLLLQVRQAIEQIELVVENKRLTVLTAKQNKELADLNNTLEKKVVERTRGIIKQHDLLKKANTALEKSVGDTIRLMSSLVNTLKPRLGEYLAAVAQLSKEMAQQMGLDDRQANCVETAAWVHDIGLLGMSDALIEKPETAMTKTERVNFQQHPISGFMLISAVKSLDGPANVILQHHERYDGKGFPKGMKKREISIEARILAAAAAYHRIIAFSPDNMKTLHDIARRTLGAQLAKELDATDEKSMIKDIAAKSLRAGANIHFDGHVVDCLLKIIGKDDPFSTAQWVDYGDLKSGMILVEDLRFSDGRLLLTRGTVLDSGSIETIASMVNREVIPGKIQVSV